MIPQVRGASRSRAAAAVLAEIRRRVAQGHREVVLTGINLGCYRDRAGGFDLARLVREAGATPGIERLAFSSLEVNHLSEKPVAAMRETPAVSPHLHVPLQSGDDRDAGGGGAPLHGGDLSRRITRLKGSTSRATSSSASPPRTSRRKENTLRVVEEAGHHDRPRLPVLASAGYAHRCRRPGAARREEVAGRAVAPPSAEACRRRLAEPARR